ncbi:MAG: hypothetical protein RLZZ597_1302 [Cyanobacteriota bacterium]|jgi:hypothetical protein
MLSFMPTAQGIVIRYDGADAGMGTDVALLVGLTDDSATLATRFLTGVGEMA